MTTPNGRKGAETERKVAAYLRTWFPLADRVLRQGRRDDKGDVQGIPFTAVQVKYWESPRLQAWVTDTLKQRDEAGTPLCLLVSRIKYKPEAEWDAYMPSHQINPSLIVPEEEAWTWLRMDLRLAAAELVRLAGIYANRSPSGQSWNITGSPYAVSEGRVYVQPMENDVSPSPTI